MTNLIINAGNKILAPQTDQVSAVWPICCLWCYPVLARGSASLDPPLGWVVAKALSALIFSPPGSTTTAQTFHMLLFHVSSIWRSSFHCQGLHYKLLEPFRKLSVSNTKRFAGPTSHFQIQVIYLTNNNILQPKSWMGFADKSKLFRLDDQQDFGGGEGLRFTWLWRQTVSASSQFALTQLPSHLLNPILPFFLLTQEY